jgi:hypothetical protein
LIIENVDQTKSIFAVMKFGSRKNFQPQNLAAILIWLLKQVGCPQSGWGRLTNNSKHFQNWVKHTHTHTYIHTNGHFGFLM